MSKKKNKTIELVCPYYVHSLPKELADILHQRQDDRFPKFEAFRYLMEKQALTYLESDGKAQSSFLVTITQLSLDWKWHRHTVTAFLEDLKKAGFLTRDPRMKERKKYGLKAARRAPQFSKR